MQLFSGFPRRVRALGLLCALVAAQPGSAKEAAFPTLEKAPSVPWRINVAPERLVVVADIHGDYNALMTILQGRKLVDENGKWVAGKDTHLVFLGDLINKGDDSRLVMDAVMRLEKEAQGRIHTLLGNHELYASAGRFPTVSKRDLLAYQDLESAEHREGVSKKLPKYLKSPTAKDPKFQRLHSAFSGEGKYAKWIRSRNAILQVGGHLFSHAGVLPEWADKADLGKVNETVRAWISFYQGVGPQPPIETRWVVERELSPLSNLRFSPGRRKSAYSKSKISDMLDHLHAKRMFVGHYLTRDRSVWMINPDYGKLVTLMDSGNSAFYGGTLSAIEIRSDSRELFTFPRPRGEHPLRATEPLVRQWNQRLVLLKEKAKSPKKESRRLKKLVRRSA